jgi:serine/threonine protein kinase
MDQIATDRWATVKHIHQGALDRDPAERAAFVDEACGGDETLRREVQSLLTYATEAESFLERPAVDVAPTGPSEPCETALVGRTVSHYQVLSLLGAGGMGEVYLARDPRLDRTVALKILPGDLALNPDHMLRFAREARAASALNHPNVATIYDVGESDGVHFIAMEHVEGETIASRIGRPLTPSDVVDVAVQAADALDVAHAKGITHRDIKPANLMLTLRGHVKVLDFGVAKMARGDEASPNGDWNVEPLTAVGGVVGSAPYMSPEQIAGDDVDPRSDVFSLGVVIYEMATGQRPFSGATRSEMTQSILHVTPEPITRLNPEIPFELERITFKCLDKSADARYQSARELLSDLWPLKRHVDAKARPGTPDSMRVDAPTAVPSRMSEASELVARGRAHLRSGSFFEVSHAASAFLAATAIDPSYAAAHAGLANAKVAQATLRAAPLVEAFGDAKAAALRALALDDQCADAQVALGQIMLLRDWDWLAAERSFQRALAINPNHAEAYLHYGHLMEALGKADRGLHLKLRGLECDQTSALAHVLIALSFWNQRRYDDVIVWVNKTLDRDPEHLFARELLAGAYWKKGDWERLLTEDLRRAEARAPSEEARVVLRDMCGEILDVYRRSGYVEAQRCILKHRQRAGELISGGQPPQERGHTDLGLVMHYAEAGDLDQAFQYLDRALDAHDPALVHLAVSPWWDSLRADPRFNKCLARMKLRPVGTVSEQEGRGADRSAQPEVRTTDAGH